MSSILLSLILFYNAISLNISPIDHLILNTNNLNSIETKLNNNETVITMNDNDIVIAFDYVGINQLFSISSISYLKDSTRKVYKSASDWIGPYVVKDNTEVNSMQIFTGGYHGSNGDGTGHRTAKTTDVNIYNTDYFAAIAVTNLIKPYNSKDYAIQETVYYTITDNTLNVTTVITALKDITIEKYYGLQTQNYIWDNNVESISDYEFLLHSDQNIKSLRASLSDIGLGTFNYVSPNKPKHFTTDYGKSYFNLVNGIHLKMNQDDQVYWQGKYTFE